jgi:hypothetical protein
MVKWALWYGIVAKNCIDGENARSGRIGYNECEEGVYE